MIGAGGVTLLEEVRESRAVKNTVGRQSRPHSFDFNTQLYQTFDPTYGTLNDNSVKKVWISVLREFMKIVTGGEMINAPFDEEDREEIDLALKRISPDSGFMNFAKEVRSREHTAIPADAVADFSMVDCYATSLDKMFVVPGAPDIQRNFFADSGPGSFTHRIFCNPNKVEYFCVGVAANAKITLLPPSYVGMFELKFIPFYRKICNYAGNSPETRAAGIAAIVGTHHHPFVYDTLAHVGDMVNGLMMGYAANDDALQYEATRLRSIDGENMGPQSTPVAEGRYFGDRTTTLICQHHGNYFFSVELLNTETNNQYNNVTEMGEFRRIWCRLDIGRHASREVASMVGILNDVAADRGARNFIEFVSWCSPSVVRMATRLLTLLDGVI
jgi:hypothetical protein